MNIQKYELSMPAKYNSVLSHLDRVQVVMLSKVTEDTNKLDVFMKSFECKKHANKVLTTPSSGLNIVFAQHLAILCKVWWSSLTVEYEKQLHCSVVTMKHVLY